MYPKSRVLALEPNFQSLESRVDASASYSAKSIEKLWSQVEKIKNAAAACRQDLTDENAWQGVVERVMKWGYVGSDCITPKHPFLELLSMLVYSLSFSRLN